MLASNTRWVFPGCRYLPHALSKGVAVHLRLPSSIKGCYRESDEKHRILTRRHQRSIGSMKRVFVNYEVPYETAASQSPPYVIYRGVNSWLARKQPEGERYEWKMADATEVHGEPEQLYSHRRASETGTLMAWRAGNRQARSELRARSAAAEKRLPTAKSLCIQ
jgi:hypothetical protein